MGCYAVLLYSVKERDGEDGNGGNGCWALAAWDSGWRKNISLDDELVAKHQFLRQGFAVRKDGLTFLLT